MKNKKLYILLILLLIGVVGVFIGGTYAKYTASISKSGQAYVAKWNFASDNNVTTFNIDLKNNYDETTLVSTRSVDGKEYKLIAPGTEGSFDITLINTSEVGVNFNISLDNIDNLPTNIKFYKDENYQNELVPGSGSITGTLAAEDSEGVVATIYFRWLYETGSISNGIATGDEADNSAGNTGGSLIIPITIRGVQVQPGLNEIRSSID